MFVTRRAAPRPMIGRVVDGDGRHGHRRQNWRGRSVSRRREASVRDARTPRLPVRSGRNVTHVELTRNRPSGVRPAVLTCHARPTLVALIAAAVGPTLTPARTS